MINLTVEEITHIHQKLIEKTGGMPGLRDFGMLESAVYSTMQSFGEEDVYPTPYERAARLAYAITMNYPFCDGNKRTGMLVMLMTLRLNRIIIAYAQQNLITLGLSVADGSKEFQDILYWIKLHLI